MLTATDIVDGKPKKLLGVIVGVISVTASVVQQELTKCLEKPENCNGLNIQQALDQPWFLVCWCHAWPVFLLPVVCMYSRSKSKSTGGSCLNYLHMELKENRLTWASICALGLLFAIMRKGDWFQLMALYGIPVGTNVSLYSSYTSIVYVFSLCILKEKFETYKMLAVFGCMTGVVIYSYPEFNDIPDRSSSKNIPSWLGIIFGLSAAMCMATFQVTYKLCLKHHRSVDSLVVVNTLSGFIGMFSIIPCMLFVFVINAFPTTWVMWEPVSIPTGNAFIVFTLIGVLGFVLNVGYQVVLLLLPINMASTLWLIQIPLSLLADWIVHDLRPDSWQIGGALLLFSSLTVMQLLS